MISFPLRTTLALGALASATLPGTAALAGEVVRIADRCAVYGPGFADLGNGTCVRLGQTGLGDPARGWSGGSASNAGLRSDGLGMLQGAVNAGHLRVRADPDFR